MVFNILLLLLVLGAVADIAITVLLHTKYHLVWDFVAWLGRRDLARKAWFASGVLMLLLGAVGVF